MRAAIAAGMALWICAGAAAATPIGEILGTWINVDPLANGLGKIEVVSSTDGALSVLGFGVCDPSYCEWGATSLVLVGMPPEYTREWAIAIWQDAPFVTVLILNRQGDVLVAEVFSYFTDGAGIPYREIVLLRPAF